MGDIPYRDQLQFNELKNCNLIPSEDQVLLSVLHTNQSKYHWQAKVLSQTDMN